MHQLAVKTATHAQTALFCVDELHRIDYIVMPVCKSLHALQINIADVYMPLIVASTQETSLSIVSDELDVVQMGLLALRQNLLHKNTLFARIERVHMLIGPHEHPVLSVVVAVGQLFECFVSEQSD